MDRFRRLMASGPVLIVLTCLISPGCVLTTVLVNKEGLPADRETVRERLVLLPPDIEMSELTTGGNLEPNAEWTAQAESAFDAVITELLDQSRMELIRYRSPSATIKLDDADLQATKLHEVVGETILLHKFQPDFGLPTKQDKFDWSLGDTVASLRGRYGADYGLFVFLRDSFSSAERVALVAIGTVLAAFAGVAIVPGGGAQVGFASLVDLQTGDIVWFSRLFRGEGDLRNAEEAKEALGILFKGFPL